MSVAEPIHVTLFRVATKYEETIVPPGYLAFAIIFKPLAAEHLLPDGIAALLDSGKHADREMFFINAAKHPSSLYLCSRF